MIFAPGVRCECVLSVLVHLWVSTSNAHTQHGRIFNIKVARFNDHYPIAGPYSEHVEHGRCYGDTKSCSLLCLKGLLIFILAFCLNILCPLTHIHFLQFALRGMMEALYLELRADKPDSKVGNFLHLAWRSPGWYLECSENNMKVCLTRRWNWQQFIHSLLTLVLPRSPDQGYRSWP